MTGRTQIGRFAYLKRSGSERRGTVLSARVRFYLLCRCRFATTIPFAFAQLLSTPTRMPLITLKRTVNIHYRAKRSEQHIGNTPAKGSTLATKPGAKRSTQDKGSR